MDPEARKENVLIRLKNILKRNDVQLWLPPYNEDVKDDQSNSAKCFSDLATSYSQILKIDFEECLALLIDLQKQSLHRLEERNIFKTAGLATLRVKVSGKKISELPIKLMLSDTTNSLKQCISEKVEVPGEKLKLISNGRVLVDHFTLESQNVKHGQTILALILQNNINEDFLTETRENHVLLEQTKQDLEFLNKQKTSNKYFSITNQTGLDLDLPVTEKNILLSAMTLHEKGRSAFADGHFSLALVFFFEADAEFKNCRADILERVDNYGLLNLDIVWTYLHIESLHYLSDAEERLKICEETFARCYGANLERLNEIKGATGNERVLFMRLHLLQGILYHCKNQKPEALSLFQRVEEEIDALKVDSKNVKLLCELANCSTKKAKLALQATYNNPDRAYEYVINRRKEKKIHREHERIRRFVDNLLCKDGSQINMTVLKQLNDMGYTNLLSVYALVSSNNEINQAFRWLENLQRELRTQYPDYVIDTFMSLEFDAAGVADVLRTFHYELNDACIATLLSTTVIGKDYFSKLIAEQAGFNPVDASCSEPSTSNAFASALNDSEPSTSKNGASALPDADFYQKEMDAVGRLQNGISNSEDSHLISDLKAEEHFLNLYKSFVL